MYVTRLTQPPPHFPGAAELRRPPATPRATPSTAAQSSAPSTTQGSTPNLITRYKLDERVQKEDAGMAPASSVSPPTPAVDWNAQAKDREAALNERKAQLILQARKRMVQRKASAESHAT